MLKYLKFWVRILTEISATIEQFSKNINTFAGLTLTRLSPADMLFAGAISAPTTLALFLGEDVLGPYCNFHTVLAR